MSDVSLTEFVVVNLTLAASAQADTFAFGTPLGVFDLTDDTSRVYGPFSSIEDVNDAGFDAATEAEANAWASAVFSQSPHVSSLYLGREDSLDATYTATLDAIEAAIGSEKFHILNLETRDEADILLAAAWAEARGGDAPKILIAQTGDAGVLDGTAGNVMLDLQASGYHRTATIYHKNGTSSAGAVATDGYLDGAWTGRCGAFNLDGARGRGTWAYKTLVGITADSFGATEPGKIYEASGNLYGLTKSLAFTSKGVMASGRFIDVTTSLDWGRIRIGEAVLSEFVSEPNVIPMTNAGINRVATVAQAVLERGVTFGHFSPDFDRKIVKPRIVDVPLADRVARAITMQGQVTLAGGIQKATFDITVLQ